MPQRQKSMKIIVAETIMYIGMFVVVGHLAADFWDRFVLQSELTNMKTSLHVLKDAVNNIETAYDNLYEELQDLTSENKVTYKPETNKVTKKRPYTLNKEDDKLQAQAVMQAKNLLDIGTTFDKTVEDFMQQCKIQPGRNISVTACPVRSNRVEKNNSPKHPKRFTGCIHRCYNCSIADQFIYPTLY